MKKFLVFILAIAIVVGGVYLFRYIKEDPVNAKVVDVTVTIDNQKVKINGPGLLALDREDDFKDGYCYEVHGFVFTNIKSDYIFDLFDCSFVDRWDKHVVPFKLDAGLKDIESITAELGIIDDDKYYSASSVSAQAGLTDGELEDFTDVDCYVNTNIGSETVLAYFTELIELSESAAFNKILAVVPDADFTLKLSAKTSKKTIDFYFILDAEDIKLSSEYGS